jgi:competence protein ComGC
LKILFLLLIASCSSVGSLRINTIPENASVNLINSDGSSRELGKTPLSANLSTLMTQGRVSTISIAKEGHQTQQMVLVKDNIKENMEVNIRLQVENENPRVLDARKTQEKLAKSLVHAHHLIIAKRFDEAEQVLKPLMVDFPHVSVSYDLMGSLFYLKKDLRSSLKFYERSLSLNPENMEAKQMVDRLRGMMQ